MHPCGIVEHVALLSVFPIKLVVDAELTQCLHKNVLYVVLNASYGISLGRRYTCLVLCLFFFFHIVKYGLPFHMRVQKSESKLDHTFDK